MIGLNYQPIGPKKQDAFDSALIELLTQLKLGGSALSARSAAFSARSVSISRLRKAISASTSGATFIPPLVRKPKPESTSNLPQPTVFRRVATFRNSHPAWRLRARNQIVCEHREFLWEL